MRAPDDRPARIRTARRYRRVSGGLASTEPIAETTTPLPDGRMAADLTEKGAMRGPYEAPSRISSGYDTERTIIRP